MPTMGPVGPTPAPDDNEPPTITNGLSSWADYGDNRTGWVSDFDAKDPDGDDIAWSLDGDDRHAFRIDASGVLAFRSSPDHDNPTDSDLDNRYSLLVVATDNGTPSKSAGREVNISVYEYFGQHEEYPCGPFGIVGFQFLTHVLGPISMDVRGAYKWLNEPRFLHWVPGASLLVFDFDQDIWAVSTDGTELRRIVDPNPLRPGRDDGPYSSQYGFGANVSPDGSRIVYSSCEFPIGDVPSANIVHDGPTLLDAGYEIGVIDIDGTGQVRLTNDGDFESLPVWSPDGTQVAFVGHDSLYFGLYDSKLFTMSADGSTVQLVISKRHGAAARVAYYPPAWSPDGQSLAVVAVRGNHPYYSSLLTVGVDGLEVRDFAATRGIVGPPDWSPNGEHLAFAIGEAKSFDGNGEDDEDVHKLPSGIYVMRVDGTDLRQVSDGLVGAPSWSPDGSEILFVSGGVYVVASDGSALRKLDVSRVSPKKAVWSPDGSRIAVLGASGDRSVMLTLDRDGTDQHILVREEKEGVLRAWRPPSSDVDLRACSGGTAVPEPEANPGLVRDCETLLGLRHTLAGIAEIKWSEDVRIARWEGISLGGSPLRVRRVELVSRGLTGTLPPELGLLTGLTKLDLGRNALYGPIPAELGSLRGLEDLNIQSNHLFGPIPPELSELKKLTNLILSGNGLTGPIPLELGGLAELEVLDLGGNSLSGPIPPELSELKKLESLILRVNGLTGPIPPELGELTNLINLDLGDNSLSGSIPPELGEMTNLWRLTLDNNLLTGPIPPELGSLRGLSTLGLNHNKLSGTIPPELSGIVNLITLYVVGNDLSGCIAHELSEIWVGQSWLERCEPKEAKTP